MLQIFPRRPLKIDVAAAVLAPRVCKKREMKLETRRKWSRKRGRATQQRMHVCALPVFVLLPPEMSPALVAPGLTRLQIYPRNAPCMTLVFGISGESATAVVVYYR